jgi:hypothetical protein
MGHTAVPLQPPLAPARRKVRRRKRLDVPYPIRQEVIRFARSLRKNFTSYFVKGSCLKYAVTNLLRSHLPPLPRKPGRPGSPEVLRASRLYNELRRTAPHQSDRDRWRIIFPKVIEGHGGMTAVQRRDAEQQLRDRVRWLRQWRRRGRKARRT